MCIVLYSSCHCVSNSFYIADINHITGADPTEDHSHALRASIYHPFTKWMAAQKRLTWVNMAWKHAGDKSQPWTRFGVAARSG